MAVSVVEQEMAVSWTPISDRIEPVTTCLPVASTHALTRWPVAAGLGSVEVNTPPILTGLPLSVAAFAISPCTSTPADDMTLTTEDGITVGLDDSVTRAEDTDTLSTEDGVIVATDESATVATDDRATVLLVRVTCTADDGVTDTAPPTDEIATASAAIVEVTALDPAETQAVLAPFMMLNAPEVTEVTAGPDDRVTVKPEEGVIVTAEDGVTRCDALREEIATTSADMVEVTALEPATTFAVLAPLMMLNEPEVTEVMVDMLTAGSDDRVTVKTEDGATVTAEDGVTVATDDKATVLLVRVT